jgi:hypothetical protein
MLREMKVGNLSCPALLITTLAAAWGCGDNLVPLPDGDLQVALVPAFRAGDVPGCALASPLPVRVAGELQWVIVTSEGHVASYDRDGDLLWSFDVPVDEGRQAEMAATPVAIGELVVIAWQVRPASGGDRQAHQAAVIDAAAGALDPRFPIVTLTASVPASDGSGPVDFLPAHAYSRAALVAGRRAGDQLGLAYVSYGNIQDRQPWHGWVFELDLDAWLAGGAGAAISSVLLVTPERDCGSLPTFDGGCGGGIWAPSGPYLLQRDDDFEIWLATGNGQLDLARDDYANTIMRVGPGLQFDPRCDAEACAEFDPRAPSEACMASCRDLFIPRLRAGDPPLAPENGRCDDLTFLECYAELDLDLGADSPAPVTLPSGRTVVVLPAKDGAVYLFDAAHMGTMLDRLQIRAFCGDNGGNCDGYNWAGTMVTEPLITEVDGAPVALIPTFYFDTTNPGGVVALDIVENGPDVTLRERWSAPARDSDEALARFRQHTGTLARIELDGVAYAVLADPAEANDEPARLYLIRIDDGTIVERADLDGPGQRYQEPAVDGTRFFVNSCDSPYALPAGPSHLEAWDVVKVAR